MKPGFEEVLELREDPIHVSSKLDLKSGPLFDILLPERTRFFKCMKSISSCVKNL